MGSLRLAELQRHHEANAFRQEGFLFEYLSIQHREEDDRSGASRFLRESSCLPYHIISYHVPACEDDGYMDIHGYMVELRAAALLHSLAKAPG